MTSSPSGRTRRTRPSNSSAVTSAMASFVRGSSNESVSTTASLPLAAVSARAERSAPFFIFLFTRIS